MYDWAITMVIDHLPGCSQALLGPLKEDWSGPDDVAVEVVILQKKILIVCIIRTSWENYGKSLKSL
jgi:hypothetical protein